MAVVVAAMVTAVSPSPAAAQDADRPAPDTQAATRIELPYLAIPASDGATTLRAHLFRPKDGGDAPRPAVVMLHGCSGLLAPSGRFFGLYRAWARTLIERGYVVLVIDSATSRGLGQTCTPAAAASRMLRERPGDAYAGLRYLQAQPFVRADRVALMGWSQGGGVALYAINAHGAGRQTTTAAPDPARDFAAAVAFYPGACSAQAQGRADSPGERDGWTSGVPLLVLFGEADVWTRLAPCAAFLDAARARGNAVELFSYPNAVHGFDAPNTPRTELPHYRTADGRIPVIGTDAAARADAMARAMSFLGARLSPP